MTFTVTRNSVWGCKKPKEKKRLGADECDWHEESPPMCGVYRVKYKDHIATKTRTSTGEHFYAYFDGEGRWSDSMNLTIQQAYNAKLLKNGTQHEWTGEPY